MALRERFLPSLPSIDATRAVIIAQLGRSRVSNETLLTLYSALGELSDALTSPLPEQPIKPLSRQANRRAQQSAQQLEARTRTMLGAIGKALVASTSAASLLATPAVARPAGASFFAQTAPAGVGALVLKPALPKVSLTNQAANGSSGGAWTDGANGVGAGALMLSVIDADHTIVATSAPGILVSTRGGHGGNGGGAGAGGSGGDGGWGGTGGNVTLNAAMDISTSGANAHGLAAISAGGGGGNGGNFAVGVGSAGSGGQGGAGGAVSVTLGANDIETSGTSADGIFASSVGGPGGSAGSCNVAICGSSGGGNSAIGGAVSVYTEAGSSIAVNGTFSKGVRAASLGGFGGNGGDSYFAAGYASNGGSAGDGGQVTVSNNGAIATRGINGDAIFAQSVGGGGGDGGDTGISLFSLGGGGSHGGGGGKVQVFNGATGVIETWGAFSRGVLAQSIGGSGGSGGSASSLISIGGNGSGTSNGGEVSVNNAGTISTHGDGSQAIFAESIGGGGGDGGGAAGLAAVGGVGGGGGGSAMVQVGNTGTLYTNGSDASAIYAQSVGGGGGDGGGTGAVIAIGGAGGDGGDGGVVDIANSGAIRTSGDRSIGVFAQSIGGGGGNGGGAASVGAFLNISVGGSGGKGGDGDVVSVNAGPGSDIRTLGERSAAIFAQSIGGGGGNGGYGAGAAVGLFGALSIAVGGTGGDGGDGDAVTVNSDGYLETIGADSQGVFAQSVGGSGGNGGFAIAAALAAGKVAVSGSVAVGGAGAGAGDGDTVTLVNNAIIDTTGDRSSGLHAQSVGGGGGHGGWSGSVAGAGGIVAGAISVSVGGSAGGGGDGGVVDVTSTGEITTSGLDAYGVLAQSVGGGGGTGGFSVSAAVGGGKTAGGASLALGGSGGLGGNGEAVEVDIIGAILTGGDRAVGILAQSLGGGGGAGGWSGGLAVGAGAKAGALSVTVGGSGGGGGDGAVVGVQSGGDITTKGDGAHAILAQSVGGGGGAGGFSVSGALAAGSNAVALNASVGGSGGDGGHAGDVGVKAEGATWTTGAASHGVFAQSVGGGGGDGGWAGRVSGAVASGKSVTLGVSLGGQGGVGGGGGDVEVDIIGEILTQGDASHGVLAQSIGGGGGTGGFTVAANFGAAKAINVGLTMGGSGGGAGEAGDVHVTTTKTINTQGDGAIGVFAQSVGGGGGSGGSAGNIALSGSQSVNVTANMGGFGASGTTGGNVEVENSGVIWTVGELSHGILAQSVGGGGGHGGMAGLDADEWGEYLAGGSGSVSFGSRSQNIALSMGGSGGAGNDGGEVKVVNSGSMRTDGAMSHVIYAQSVGGGGGDAGVATSVSGAMGAGKNGVYSIAMGGFGGVAGNGGKVTVGNTGALVSSADGSHGVFAQSVGGGGGAGGDARGFALAFSSSKSKGQTSVSVSLGGYGGAAGDGGAVLVDNGGAIFTDGAQSFGVLAQSVGGGGGAGGAVSTQGEEIPAILDLVNKGEGKGAQIAIGGSGAAAGDGGAVRVVNGGLVHTAGQGSHAIFAQSVGGGGGLGGSGLAGEVSIGGQGAAAGDGGAVFIDNKGRIVTEGDMARGVFAQSVGGGGGVGGGTDAASDDEERGVLAATMTTVGNLTATAEFVNSLKQPAFGVGIGGMGGAAGDGGKVTVINAGTIETFGLLSTGVFAQSVGGGGGQGGEGVMSGVGQVVFSGLGGSAGDGGEVIVTNTGDITTQGAGATGIFAQSVGGGGGLAGDYSLGLASWGNTTAYGGQNYSDILDLQLNPINANGGDGGDVSVTNTGNITVTGAGAVGIFAQSVGGGGGLFGGKLLLGFIGSMEGVGEGGKVSVVQNGNVIVGGKNGIGAVFQSASKDGDDDINVVLNGDVKGGAVYGMGVLMDGGKNNTLTLNGVTWADSKLAITATGGNDAVIANKGLIGNVDLGLGVNSVTNTDKSFFVSLDYVKLNGGNLINQGLLTPGDLGVVQTTTVQGNFIQSATGEMLTDLDLGRTGKSGEIDQLKLTGSIEVKGAFTVNILNPGYALPGDHTVAILDGSGTLTQSGLTLNKPISAVASFALTPTSQDLNLSYSIDFSPTGLNGNQTALGDHVNAIQLAGSSPTFAPITAELFYVPTAPDLAEVYDGFSPQTYAAQQGAQIYASQQFADGMFSCPRASEGAVFSERGCVWVKPSARWLALSSTSAAMAYDENSTGLSGGFEAAVGDGAWRVGGALSAEDVNGGVRRRVNADGTRLQAGLVAKRDPDQGFGLGLAVHGGQADMDTRRLVPLPASAARVAQAKQDITFLGATARASYRWGSDRAYLKPMLEASAVKVETKGFAETGAGALNLVAPNQKDTFGRLSFKVETGGELKAGGAALRPYGRVGVSYSPDAGKARFAAAFQGAPAAAASGFTVNPGLDKTSLETELGMSVIGSKASGRVAWTGQFGKRTDNQTLSLKLSIPF